MSRKRRSASRHLAGTATEHVSQVEYYRDEFFRDMKRFYASVDAKRCGPALDALVDAAKAKQGVSVNTRWSGRKERTLDTKRKEVGDRLQDMTDVFHSHCVRR